MLYLADIEPLLLFEFGLAKMLSATTPLLLLLQSQHRLLWRQRLSSLQLRWAVLWNAAKRLKKYPAALASCLHWAAMAKCFAVATIIQRILVC